MKTREPRFKVYAWDGDWQSKDLLAGYRSGKETYKVHTQKEANEAAKKFMAAYPPKAKDAYVRIEKSHSRYGTEFGNKWGTEPDGNGHYRWVDKGPGRY